MTLQPQRKNDNQAISSKDRLKKTLRQIELEQIISNSYDAIFVTDKSGCVLIASQSTEKVMGLKPEEIVGSSVTDLVKRRVYDWSPTLKAIETRSVVTGFVRTRIGFDMMVTSTPMFDENGEIVMVIANAREKDLIDKCLAAIEKERAETARYKTAAEYLSERDLEQNSVVAKSRQMRQLFETSSIIAKTDSTVILAGESGTGKEVMARYIHRNSLRSREPFIPVNCAAIPHELLESEFFGYVRGAFTGANSQGKPGLFEIADKGTLFLDEIAELPLSMQSKLLRVLENGELKRVGGISIFRTNVRLIAATNRDLKTMVDQSLFRSDLYYRLNVIPIKLPPLRERSEDILVLAHKFLGELNRKYGFKKTFTDRTTHEFINYNWPGNVRELRNVIERLAITSSQDNLSFENNTLVSSKPLLEIAESLSPEAKIVFKGTLKSVIKRVEEDYIKRVLAECDGRVGEAASRLGIHRTMLYRKMKKYECE